MKLDFSKFTNVASGSMTTVKAALLFYMSNDSVKVEDQGAGKSAGMSKLLGNTAALHGGVAESFGSAVKSSGSVKNAVAETKEQLKKVEEQVKTAADRIDNSIGEALPEQAAEFTKQKGNYSKVTFQFNPASLHISAYGGGMAAMTNFEPAAGKGTGSDQVDYGPIDETVTVSFKVIFDAVRNERAFLSDRINPGPTNLIRQGADLIKSAPHTVRPVAEGFLAAVRNRSTRGVIFQWGSLRYGGYLNKAQCRYTMFDMEGEAVRAEVDLALVCSCHGGHDNGKEWRERYHAFMEGRKSDFSFSGSKLKSVVNVATGKVEKACILFRANTVPTKTDAKPVSDASDTDRLSIMAAAVSNMAAAIWSEANGTGKKRGAEKVEEAGYVPVKIHYNPTSITMHSRGGEMITREGNSTDPSAAAKYQRSAMPAETAMSVELLFDETDNANAFMLDSGMGSPTGAVKAGMNLKSGMEGREYSVAPVSELFVAATMSPDSRMVCFVWNKMVFWGELCEVEVDYTMFNNRGNPIRSKVSIRIRQSGKAGSKGDFEKIWKRAYDKLPDEAEKLAKNKGLTASSGNYIASNLFRM